MIDRKNSINYKHRNCEILVHTFVYHKSNGACNIEMQADISAASTYVRVNFSISAIKLQINQKVYIIWTTEESSKWLALPLTEINMETYPHMHAPSLDAFPTVSLVIA